MEELLMFTRRRFATACAGAVAGLAMPSIGRAATLEPVTVRLDWVPGADHGALFLAKARGYYAAQGLDVQLLDGKGSVVALQAVASGNDTIGIANLATMAMAVGTGAPLTAIGCILQKAPDSIISLESSGIRAPKDLEGKRFGFIPADAGERMFPAFAQKNDVDSGRIRKIQLNHSAAYTSLLLGNVDFICGWAIADALKLGAVKPIAPPMVMSDHGVNMLSNGFFVTPGTIRNRPNMLKRFLAATVKGAGDAQADPKAAVDAIVAARPSTNGQIALQEANMLHSFLHTDNTTGHGFGWMAKEDWQRTVELLKSCCGVTNKMDVEALYTNKYLPA